MSTAPRRDLQGVYGRPQAGQFGGMKRIAHAAENVITSNEIADRLMKYAVRVSQLGTSSAVTIPLLEPNGTVADHTLVINAASQFDVVDVAGLVDGHELDQSGEPEFPPPLATSPVVQLVLDRPAAGEFDDFSGITQAPATPWVASMGEKIMAGPW